MRNQDQFLTLIGEMLEISESEKVAAAKALHVIGAFTGGAINFTFIDHFQDKAHGHFTIRRLERTYGEEAVREEYERCTT